MKNGISNSRAVFYLVNKFVLLRAIRQVEEEVDKETRKFSNHFHFCLNMISTETGAGGI